jgi:CRP/FNR family cyclic AMP-dependent transcriptional regulator
MVERTFPAGTIVFKEGDASDCAYVVTRGAVEILKKAGHGDVQLATLGPGATFGEMGLFDNNPRSASARTKEETVLDVINAAELEHLIEQCPTRLLPIMRAVFDRLRAANKRVSENEKATAIVECDYQTIRITPADEASHCRFAPIEVLVAQLPFRIHGYPAGTEPDEKSADRLYLPCEASPMAISRAHLEIERRENTVSLVDMGSRFGTFLNGLPIGRGRGRYSLPLGKGTHEVVLGDKQSPYRIRLECK